MEFPVDDVDNREFLSKLVRSMWGELPEKKIGHSGDSEVWENMDEGTLTAAKAMLDDMHKAKIDMADEIFVINVDGYIGDSTRSEIEYAKMTGKAVRFLEPIVDIGDGFDD